MVAKVRPLKSSAAAVSYYEKDGYYAKDDPEHRDASFWHGEAAKDLGLKGHVLPGEFEDALAGWVPGDGDPSRADARGRERPPPGLGHHLVRAQVGVAGGGCTGGVACRRAADGDPGDRDPGGGAEPTRRGATALARSIARSTGWSRAAS